MSGTDVPLLNRARTGNAASPLHRPQVLHFMLWRGQALILRQCERVQAVCCAQGRWGAVASRQPGRRPGWPCLTLFCEGRQALLSIPLETPCQAPSGVSNSCLPPVHPSNWCPAQMHASPAPASAGRVGRPPARRPRGRCSCSTAAPSPGSQTDRACRAVGSTAVATARLLRGQRQGWSWAARLRRGEDQTHQCTALICSATPSLQKAVVIGLVHIVPQHGQEAADGLPQGRHQLEPGQGLRFGSGGGGNGCSISQHWLVRLRRELASTKQPA